MTRAILGQFNDLEEQLSGYNAVFSYRLNNLCVKAEEQSLLAIQVNINEEVLNLEDCTTIAKKDEYSFAILPDFAEDMPALAQAIKEVHPEFKLTVETMSVDSVDEARNPTKRDVPYMLATMPEVNDDRYDVLNDAVKLCYDECKAQMEAANTKADAKFAKLSVAEPDDEKQQLERALEKMRDQWFGQRDKLYEDKLKEIEEAHKKWLLEKEEAEKKKNATPELQAGTFLKFS